MYYTEKEIMNRIIELKEQNGDKFIIEDRKSVV